MPLPCDAMMFYAIAPLYCEQSSHCLVSAICTENQCKHDDTLCCLDDGHWWRCLLSLFICVATAILRSWRASLFLQRHAALFDVAAMRQGMRRTRRLEL